MTLTPREVVEFFRTKKCPVCGSQLDYEEVVTFKVQSEFEGDDYNGAYYAFAECKEDCLHYEMRVSWVDPKKISVTQEELSFEYKSNYFEVKRMAVILKSRGPGYANDFAQSLNLSVGPNVINDVTVMPIDEDGETYLQDKATKIMLPGNVLNFKKFSRAKFANRIKMIMVFT